MALHLLKLIWNRKRANFLIITEILLSFLVLAAVTTVAVHYWRNYQSPLGFSYERIWDVHVRVPRGIESTPDVERERYARMQRLVDTARQMPEVESVGHLQMGTFRNWQWNSDVRLKDGRQVDFNGNRADDELARTLSITLVEGRWFSREDTGQHWDAVVLNRRMAREVFGDAPAAGQLLPVAPNPRRASDSPPDRPQRVVGVIEDFRQFGEYSTPGNYMITRNDIISAAAAPLPVAGEPTPSAAPAELPGILAIRVRPGVTADFEERLVKALHAQAPDWSFSMKPTTDALKVRSGA